VIVDQYGRPIEVLTRRTDAWQNQATGIGTAADKSVAGRFEYTRRLTDMELTNLYNASPTAAKIVEKRPEEIFRAGYELEADGVDVSEAEDLYEHLQDELHVDEHFQTAETLANLYGGYLLVMGADDGNMPDEPLDENRIKSFSWLNGMDRRFAYVLSYYTDPQNPKCGQPETYLTSNAVAGVQMGRSSARAYTKPKSAEELRRSGFFTSVVHETRCLRFEGVRTDPITMASLAGWTWSVMQRVYDEMKKFEHAFDSTGYLLSDASQAVFTLKGLINQISAGNLGLVEKRIAWLEQWRSVMHGIVIDEGEKFERSPTTFAGIADVLDKMMLKFCAACDMPVTEIFGRAAGGLQAPAANDAETRKWFDKIDTQRRTKVAPKLRRLCRLVTLAGDSPIKVPKVTKTGRPLKWQINFKPLLVPTDKEQADTELAVAQRDQIYANLEVVSTEELALDRQELYPSMDVEAREAAIEAATSFDPHENDPEELPPAGGVIPPMGSGPSEEGAPPGPTPPPKVPAKKAPAKKTTDSRRRRR